MHKKNKLADVTTSNQARYFYNNIALLQTIPHEVTTRVLVIITDFVPGRRMPWNVQVARLVNGLPGNQFQDQIRGYFAQSDNPDGTYYLSFRPFDNPMAKVKDGLAAQKFIGTSVVMWEGGWLPSVLPHRELRVLEYNPRRSQEEGSGSSPWWMRNLTPGERSEQWYGQATNELSNWYILPKDIYLGTDCVADAATPAESLSRIFLGGHHG